MVGSGGTNSVEDLRLALSTVKIPRCYYLPVVLNQIHGFSDASERAYAAVVYLMSVYCSGNVSINIVALKTRVAPLYTSSGTSWR